MWSESRRAGRPPTRADAAPSPARRRSARRPSHRRRRRRRRRFAARVRRPDAGAPAPGPRRLLLQRSLGIWIRHNRITPEDLIVVGRIGVAPEDLLSLLVVNGVAPENLIARCPV